MEILEEGVKISAHREIENLYCNVHWVQTKIYAHTGIELNMRNIPTNSSIIRSGISEKPST